MLVLADAYNSSINTVVMFCLIQESWKDANKRESKQQSTV